MPTVGEGEHGSKNSADITVNVNGINNRATVSAEPGGCTDLQDNNVQLTEASDPRAAQAVKMKRKEKIPTSGNAHQGAPPSTNFQLTLRNEK